MISAGYDKQIVIWDTSKRAIVKRLQNCHTHLIRALSVCSYNDVHYLISGAWDTFVKVWDLNLGKVIHTLKGHTNRVKVVTTYIPTDQSLPPLVISGGDDFSIRIWNLLTGESVRVILSHAHFVLALSAYYAPSISRHILASASSDKSIKLWDLTTGEEVGCAELIDDTASCMALLSSQGNDAITSESTALDDLGDSTPRPLISSMKLLLCCGMTSGMIRLFDPTSLVLVQSISAHTHKVTGLSPSHSSSSTSPVFFSVSLDGFLKSWSLQDGYKCHISTKLRPAERKSAKADAIASDPSQATIELHGLVSMSIAGAVTESTQDPSNSAARENSNADNSAASEGVSTVPIMASEDLYVCGSDGIILICEIATIRTGTDGRHSLARADSVSDACSSSKSRTDPAGATSETISAVVGSDAGSRLSKSELDEARIVSQKKLPPLERKQRPTGAVVAASPKRSVRRIIENASSSLPPFHPAIDYSSATAADLIGQFSGTSITAMGTRSSPSYPSATGSGIESGSGTAAAIPRASGQKVRVIIQKPEAKTPYLMSRGESGVVEELAQAAMLLQAALGSNGSKVGGLTKSSLSHFMHKQTKL